VGGRAAHLQRLPEAIFRNIAAPPCLLLADFVVKVAGEPGPDCKTDFESDAELVLLGQSGGIDASNCRS
jgi:hypothetical protein